MKEATMTDAELIKALMEIVSVHVGDSFERKENLIFFIVQLIADSKCKELMEPFFKAKITNGNL